MVKPFRERFDAEFARAETTAEEVETSVRSLSALRGACREAALRFDRTRDQATHVTRDLGRRRRLLREKLDSLRSEPRTPPSNAPGFRWFRRVLALFARRS